MNSKTVQNKFNNRTNLKNRNYVLVNKINLG